MTELRVETRFEPRGGWVLVPLILPDGSTLELVLDSGSFLSAISERTRDELNTKGLLEPRGPERRLPRGVSLAGQPIADLPVRLSRRAEAVQAPGLLGLDFLARYEEVRFHFPTMCLTLIKA